MALGLAGCGSSDQDIPPGADFRNPTGAAPTPPGGGAKTVSPQEQAIANKARNFGEEMSRKHAAGGPR